LYSSKESITKTLLLKKKIWNIAIRRFAPFKCADFFTDIGGLTSNILKRDCVVEIMTHPGHAAFEEQNRLLLENWEDTLRAEVTFISYKALRSDAWGATGPKTAVR